MADLTFYTNPMSRGRIARWMLEEVGEPYETVLLDYGTTMKSADYLALNPLGKVPAIKHRDTIVTEGAAICAYLADVFPDAMLAPPPGHRKRGPYYRWLFFAAGPVEAAVTDKALEVSFPEFLAARDEGHRLGEVAHVLVGEMFLDDRLVAVERGERRAETFIVGIGGAQGHSAVEPGARDARRAGGEGRVGKGDVGQAHLPEQGRALGEEER